MTKAKRRHLVAAALTAVGAGGIALAPAAGAVPSAGADTRNVTAYVWASNVNVRYAPYLSERVLGKVGPGNVSAHCQNTGEQVTYGRYTNHWWTYITAHGGGWINNVFIRGGNNNEPVPGIGICP
ncbi:hypothetical protein ADK86_32185 [Streptomyces sp. NRRL F-5755]|uniref:hypothetical protein n=1 Tax=Streptomyces sp. NRRL F-5755 TaxID=1519475 RepID=UPI0006B00052|nr:hypothetical protein [Streptomyces sp. NRRL F-5755]KOT88542.1 hypothetical protein ADK86_32185 [Streptomyces sp. NRRL F-5755]